MAAHLGGVDVAVMSRALKADAVTGFRRNAGQTASAGANTSRRNKEYLDGTLSGGQRQRGAVGWAIVREPQVFCMEEPLSNVEPHRAAMHAVPLAKFPWACSRP